MSKAIIEIMDVPGPTEQVQLRVQFEPGIGKAKELKHLSHYLATVATAAMGRRLDKMGKRSAKHKPNLSSVKSDGVDGN